MPNKFDITELVTTADLLDEQDCEIEFEHRTQDPRRTFDRWCRPRHYSGVADLCRSDTGIAGDTDAERQQSKGGNA